MRRILRKLGLTPNEVEIYITLLQAGELSVYQLAPKAGLHRQVCYDALERLLDKGFVSYIIKDNKKCYKPLEPKKIQDSLEEKKEEFNLVLPKLEEIYHQELEETKVEVIKGKLVLRIIYNDIFKVLQEKKETLYAMGVDEDKFLEFDKVWIHGLLHLIGYNHIKNRDYFEMNKIEKKILDSIN